MRHKQEDMKARNENKRSVNNGHYTIKSKSVSKVEKNLQDFGGNPPYEVCCCIAEGALARSC